MTTQRLLYICGLLLVAAVIATGTASAATATAGATMTLENPDVATPTAQSNVSTAAGSFPVTLTDATGTPVTIDSRPDRVTTTNPSAAQTLWTLGAESQVVGVTQYASYLDGAETRRNVSAAGLGISVERVVATEPDLVLAPNATSPQTVETLRAANLTVYHFPAATDFADVAAKTQTIGRVTGNTAAAVETNRWMWQNVAAIETRAADGESPKILYPLLGGFAVGNNTFINEIITTAGGENIAADEFDGYKQLNDETVLALDPDVLLVTDQTEGQIVSSEPYSLTTAGQNNRTASLNVNYLNQPAPRSVVYATRNLTTQLQSNTGAAETTTGDSEPAFNTTDETTSDTTDSDAANTTADDTQGTGVSAPGFGGVVAVVALTGVTMLARIRSAI
jgi:ABC-type Fe3+-hydroxamate transport system, periplasmic component